MDGPLAGRPGTALVIGGSGAIGAAVCRRLAEAGSDVVLTYRSNEDAATATAKHVTAAGRRAALHRLDTTSDEEVTALVDKVVGTHGGIHTLVTAAAPVARQRWTSHVTPTQFEEQMSQDVGAFHRVVVATIPALRESHGSVVAVTSVANRRYVLRDMLSSAPKAAIEAVVQAVAAEEGRNGVRANAVGVGILEEGMAATLLASGDVRERDMQHALSLVPLRRLGVADDVAGAVVFLAGDQAAYVTGQWIDVDGGYSV